MTTQTAAPTSRVWGSAGLGCRWIISISIKFPLLLLLLLGTTLSTPEAAKGVKSGRTIRP